MQIIKIINLNLFLSAILASQAQLEPNQALDNMSLREKIGQCFIVAAASNFAQPTEQLASMMQTCPYNLSEKYVTSMIQDYNIGGVIFLFKSDPLTQMQLTNKYQALAKTTLLVAQDSEWGLSMRLDLDPEKVIRYPRNLTLGAICDRSLIYKIGREIGKQCAAIGVHLNLAPVVDVNNNLFNPVIHDRSFGDNPKHVTLLATEFIHGLQSAGVLACAKHFPGHGDTNVDSHISLPVIKHTRQHLNQIELVPFKAIIKTGINAIMTAHLAVPNLDNSNAPASLSPKIVTELLQKELGFNGLIITDGLGMDAARKNYAPGELELAAFLAGNDILLCPLDVPMAINQIEQAIRTGKVTEQELDRRVLKILRAKQQVLNHQAQNKSRTTGQIKDFLVRPKAQDLQVQAYRAAITLVPSSNQFVFNHDSFASSTLVQIGSLTQDYFSANCKHHDKLVLKFPANLTNQDVQVILKQTKNIPQVVIAISELNKFASQDFGISQNTCKLITDLQEANKKVVLVLFGTPYATTVFKETKFKETNPNIIVAYEDVIATQQAILDVLRGIYQPTGILPISM